MGQLGPQLPEVVYFAVVGKKIATVGTFHGLVTGRGRIYNGKPSMAQSYKVIYPETLVIGSAMKKLACHPPDYRRIHPFSLVIIDAGYSAHHTFSFVS
jgi:hypothetical protein